MCRGSWITAKVSYRRLALPRDVPICCRLASVHSPRETSAGLVHPDSLARRFGWMELALAASIPTAEGAKAAKYHHISSSSQAQEVCESQSLLAASRADSPPRHRGAAKSICCPPIRTAEAVHESSQQSYVSGSKDDQFDRLLQRGATPDTMRDGHQWRQICALVLVPGQGQVSTEIEAQCRRRALANRIPAWMRCCQTKPRFHVERQWRST